MKIAKQKSSTVFLDMLAKRAVLQEGNDCAPRAIAVVAGIPYEKAIELCANFGRKAGDGMDNFKIVEALKSIGFKTERIIAQEMISKYPKPHRNVLKNVTTHHPARFPKVWKNGKRYLAFTKGHVLAIVDGENHDWTKGRALQIRSLFLVEEA